MKTRVITGVVAGILFIGVLFLMNTLVFPIVVSLLSVIAVYEIEKTSKLVNAPIMVVTLAISALIPMYFHFGSEFSEDVLTTGGIIYIIGVLILMLLKYEQTRFEQVVIAVFSSLAVPFGFSVMIMLRDISISYPHYDKTDGVFLLIFGLFASWLTDAFAYFAGSKLGKHKLCPKISPKKTVEGAIGGIVGAMLFNIGLFFVFSKFFFTHDSVLNYFTVAILSVLLSVISMFGDLSASAIKRNYDVKDFGNLLPGHGGIMDRFDSCLFVLPALYAVVIQIN